MLEILTFGQRSTQKVKVKVKVNWSRSKSTDTGPGRVTGGAVDPMTSSYDVSLTWTRADVDKLAWLLTWLMTCLGLTWLLTWSDDVIM